MSTVEKSIEVAVPLAAAYEQWTRMETYPTFMSSVESITLVDDTTTHWKVNVAGVDREFDSTITDQVPGSHIAWSSVGELVHHGRVSFNAINEQTTRVTLKMEWEPDGFVEKAGDTLQVDDVALGRDLKRFKELMETGATP